MVTFKNLKKKITINRKEWIKVFIILVTKDIICQTS